MSFGLFCAVKNRDQKRLSFLLLLFVCLFWGSSGFFIHGSKKQKGETWLSSQTGFLEN